MTSVTSSNIDGGNVIFDKKGMGIVLDRDCRLVIKDVNDRERFRERVPYGANILVKKEVQSIEGKNLLNGILILGL